MVAQATSPHRVRSWRMEVLARRTQAAGHAAPAKNASVFSDLPGPALAGLSGSLQSGLRQLRAVSPAAGHPVLEKRLRGHPVTLDGGHRHLEDLGDLLDGQAREILHLDDLCLPFVEL